MPLRPITVESYAGARADETPRLVTIDGRRLVIVRLLNESVEESLVTNTQTRRFRVVTAEGRILDILRQSDGAWYLQSELNP